MAPALVVIAVLVLYPSVQSIVASLQKHDLTSSDNGGFAGIKNYATVLGSSGFRVALLNSAGYFVFVTVLTLVLGFAVALWLQMLRGAWRAVAMCIIILPWAVPGTVGAILWSFILNPTGSGLLNSVLKGLGVIDDYKVWLNEPVTGIFMISLTVVWSAMPLAATIMLASVEAIPQELYEASQLDGTGVIQRFFRITVPLVRPSIAIVLLNSAVLAIGLFDQVYVLVGLDPSKLTIAGAMYLYAFRDFNFGHGYAAAVVATVITAVISFAYLRLVYREVEF